MAIISISVDSETLREADDVAMALGLGSRSEVFRKGVKSFVSDVWRAGSVPKTADAVLVLMHYEEHEAELTKLKHAYEDIVRVQTHTNIDPRRCLEVFVLKGSGRKIAEFAKALSSSRRVKYSKLVIM